jgi:hypothetical protein
MLRDAALAWVRSHVSRQWIYDDFARRFDDASSSGVTFGMLLGKDMSSNRKPYLVHWFAQQLYVFQLTIAQAAQAEVTPDAVRWQTSTKPGVLGLATGGPVELLRIDVEHAERLPWNRPIAVEVAYEAPLLPDIRAAVRMDYGLADGRSVEAFHQCLFPPPGKNWMRCSFPPMGKDLKTKPPAGPLAVFLSFCTTPDPGTVGVYHQISNVCAALVTVAP